MIDQVSMEKLRKKGCINIGRENSVLIDVSLIVMCLLFLLVRMVKKSLFVTKL